MDELIVLALFLFSIYAHEISHTFVAHKFKLLRTVNQRAIYHPMNFFGLIGSFLVPGVIVILSGIFLNSIFTFGWAKGIKLKPGAIKYSEEKTKLVIVAFAGPAINFYLFLCFFLYANYFLNGCNKFLAAFIVINGLLAIVNLIPIRPLDGGVIAFTLLGEKLSYILTLISFGAIMYLVYSFGMSYLVPLNLL